MRRLGRISFPITLLLIIFLQVNIAAAQESTRIVQEYRFSDYIRHPRMEQEDRLRGRAFQYGPGLEIISNVDDVEVRLFDEKMGRTPWESSKLPSGSYRVRLERTGFEAQEFWITLNNSTRTVVVALMLRSTGTLVLKGLPPNAQVSIDREVVEGREITVEAGRRALSVTAFGWEPIQTTLDVRSGVTTEWTYQGRLSDFSLNSLKINPRTLPPDDPRGFGLTWSATAPGTGEIIIRSPDGLPIDTLFFDIEALKGTVGWIPESSPGYLADGSYGITATATGRDGRASTVDSSLRIDSRYNRSPRMSYGPIPGLLYAPGSTMLPPGIGQVSTGAGFDARLGGPDDAGGAPVTLSFRFSPSNRWESAAKIKIRVKDPFEQTGAGMDVSVMWRAVPDPGPFSANMALSFSYMGFTSDFSRIPTDKGAFGVPGFMFGVPTEYGWEKWSLVFSPGIHLLLLGEDAANWSFTAPIRTAGELGFGLYYETETFLIGGSTALRSPDAPRGYLDWTLWSGLEGRVSMPGSGSYFSAYGGLRLLDGSPVFSAGIDFGIVG